MEIILSIFLGALVVFGLIVICYFVGKFVNNLTKIEESDEPWPLFLLGVGTIVFTVMVSLTLYAIGSKLILPLFKERLL